MIPSVHFGTVLVLKDWLNIIYNDTDIVSIYTLENTKGAIKKGQSRETGKKMSNTDTTKKPGANSVGRER